MTKRITLALFAALLGGPAVTYAAFSFIAWDCNPHTWNEFWRTVYLFAALGAGSGIFFALNPNHPAPSRWLP